MERPRGMTGVLSRRGRAPAGGPPTGNNDHEETDQPYNPSPTRKPVSPPGSTGRSDPESTHHGSGFVVGPARLEHTQHHQIPVGCATELN